MTMQFHVLQCRSRLATALYDLLDPVAFGLFAAALVFDVIYAYSPEVLWGKGAAWLLAFGLVAAIIPRLINLVHVWIVARRSRTGAEHLDFWLNLVAIVVAIVNAFVHSRDAYGVLPEGLWLSAITVALLCVARIVLAFHKADYVELRREELSHE